MNATADTAPGLAQLTSLRFVAAFFVMLSHLVFLREHPNAAVSGSYNLMLSEGGSGVAFFYVLSGFVVSYAYHDRLLDGRMPYAQYLLLRIARIAPLHWLVAGFFIVWLVVIKGAAPSASTILMNLALLQSWSPVPTVYFSLNAPSWSLSDELFFYLLLPLLVPWRTRVLVLLAGAAVAVVAALALWVTARPEVLPVPAEWFFYVNPVVRLIEFMVGIVLFRWHRNGRGAGLAGSVPEIVLLAAWPLLMVGVTLLQVPPTLRYQVAYLPLMALLVLVMAHGRGLVSRWMRRPAWVLLGQASFSLYLIHRPIITFAHQVAVKLWGSRHDLVLAFALVVVCVGASVLVHRWIERPMHEWLRVRINGWFRRRHANA